MSLASRLEALKETFDNKNATLRILFEQRLDTLRNNIISFIGNALHDETAAILNESDATRAFVVDRILEIVSDNLESEKETTIFKLINKVNHLTTECDTLTIKNNELKTDNDALTHKQNNIDTDSDALHSLKQSVTEKELKIKTQSDKIKSIEDDLQIKTHEFERQQTQNDEQHEHIEKLHAQLESALRNLQQRQTEFEQQSIEHKQMKAIHDANHRELKKGRKQIESLRASLMKSESERLVLNKQYMEIGTKLECITKDQNKRMKQFEREERDKNQEILIIKQQFQELIIQNKALKRKLHEQSHCLSKKMKKELSKTKTLCDDVSILRKQLESERNISKMYVDELQKLKMELNTKERKVSDAISSQKKKMHKYYQKMIDANMSRLRDEYESHIKELKQKHEEKVRRIQENEQQKFTEKQNELLQQVNERKAEHSEDKAKWNATEVEVKECMGKLDEYKTKIDKYQKDNQILKDQITKHNEAKESWQRLMYERQKQNEDLTTIVTKLKKQKESIQRTTFEDQSKANVMEFELKQQLDHVTLELQQIKKENKSMKLRLNQQSSSRQQTQKSNWKYQQKMNAIRVWCGNIRQEIRNNKNEIDYMKSSVSMQIQRMFHEMKISFNDIQSKSTRYLLNNESEMKQQMNAFKQLQKKEFEQKVKCALMDSHKVGSDEWMANVNMREIDIDELQNEVDTIKNELAHAKIVLSPKKITFQKISMPSSINSSMLISRAPSPHPATKTDSHNSKPSIPRRRESFDTATIRKLRSDLQSLEANYKYSKKQTKKKYVGSNSTHS
eukprot:152169_1